MEGAILTRKDKTAVRVQKGVFYSPRNHFYAFDIYINGTEFLDVDEANALFEAEGLLHAQTLFRGTLEDCLQYSNQFVSTIPPMLGLPEIAENFCEGVIIKPVKVSRFNNDKRVILKNKNERWTEKKSFEKAIKRNDALPEKVKKLQEAIATYATENRLDNVLSKIGEVSIADFKQVLGLFSKDIVEDFTKDYQSVLADMDKKELKLVKKSLGRVVPLMVRRKLKK